MAGLLLRSNAINPDRVSQAGCFTTLPVRKSRCDDLANAASRRLLDDWKTETGYDGLEESHSCLSELGNLCSFMFPESPPDRLGVLTYLVELAFVRDDLSKHSFHKDDGRTKHGSEALVADGNRKVIPGSNSDVMEKLASRWFTKATEIDPKKALAMIDSYRAQWLAVKENENSGDMQSLDCILSFRAVNGSMDLFWSMARFGMDLDLTRDELDSVQHIFDSANNALILTNRYYNLDREPSSSFGPETGRALDTLKRLVSNKYLSVESAHLAIKEKILDYEKEFVSRRASFYENSNEISSNVKHWIDIAGMAIGGNHYWCTQSPRQQSWVSERADLVNDGIDFAMVATVASPDQTSAPLSEPMLYCKEYQQPEKSSIPIALPVENLPVGDESCWQKPDMAALLAPCDYIRSMPSKGVRGSLIDTLNNWMQLSKESKQIIQEVVQLLHDASLVLDDMEDNSPLRRGRPAVHTIFGHSQAINSANFMFVKAVQIVRQLRNPQAVDVLLEELENLYAGQSLDLCWKFQLQCPTEEEYLNMVDNKTGGMFRMLLRLMLGESHYHTHVAFDKLALLFGRFFQVRDDYMNLKSNLYSNQKGACEDLDEGKFSFPIVCCIQKEPKYRSHILGVFRQRPIVSDGGAYTLPVESKQHILSLLESAGALKMTFDYVHKLEIDLEAEIRRLEVVTGELNPMMHLLVKSLSIADNPA